MICLDIPMPDNCGQCRLMADGWCRPLQGDSHLNRYAADMDKRPDWCPLKDGAREAREGNEPRKLNDLIRIEDAIRVLCRKICTPGPACLDSYCKEMWEAFDNIERVDAVPVRHGRWIEDPDDDWGCRCSECGHLELYQFDYCSSCGARMDGKGGDGNG